jgi:glycine cleavage system H lipoate-binding protein
VELPEPGGSVSQGSSFGAVESVKATSDINSPISGEIVEVNTKLSESPGAVILYLYSTCFFLHDLFIYLLIYF